MSSLQAQWSSRQNQEKSWYVKVIHLDEPYDVRLKLIKFAFLVNLLHCWSRWSTKRNDFLRTWCPENWRDDDNYNLMWSSVILYSKCFAVAVCIIFGHSSKQCKKEIRKGEEQTWDNLAISMMWNKNTIDKHQRKTQARNVMRRP